MAIATGGYPVLQCAFNSSLNSPARSSGKKMRPDSRSTRRLVPGIVCSSQCDHFTSKKISSVPQTMSVGAFKRFQHGAAKAAGKDVLFHGDKVLRLGA